MTKSEYREKLRDPRWQKLRLAVMERAGFECENCGDKDKELQIHHPAYRKGAEPWEYKPDELACLCADCHESATFAKAHWNELALAEHGSMDSFLSLVRDGVIDEACITLIRMMLDHAASARSNVGFSCSIADVAIDLAEATESKCFRTSLSGALRRPKRSKRIDCIISAWSKGRVENKKRSGAK